MSLPPGQQRILSHFAEAEEQGRQASRAEIAEALGYAFPSAVSKHVEALQRKGYLVADREKKRNVRLTEKGWGALGRTPADKGVPIIGAIAAGTPILASEHVEGFLEDLAPAPGRFALRVRGDSMVDAGILDGDLAIIDHDQEVPNGGIGAVIIEDVATLKRVRYRKNEVVLEPENKRYAPLVVDRRRASGGFQIVGPLRFVVRTPA